METKLIFLGPFKTMIIKSVLRIHPVSQWTFTQPLGLLIKAENTQFN